MTDTAPPPAWPCPQCGAELAHGGPVARQAAQGSGRAPPRPVAASLRLAACAVLVEPDAVETRLPGGQRVLGIPMHDASYRRTAQAHGYGTDVARMNRCHEVTHTLLAHVLGLPCSPVFRQLASGDHEQDDLLRWEEAAVLALEVYANALGVDLVEVARRWSA